MPKYAALREFLRRQEASEVPMKFSEIERLIGKKLPKSARTYRAWWSNNASNSVITKEWLEAGFKSERVDMSEERLVFRRLGKRAGPGSKPREWAQASGFSEAPSGMTSGTTDHPAFGLMKGIITIAPGVDLTEPADPDWGRVYD